MRFRPVRTRRRGDRAARRTTAPAGRSGRRAGRAGRPRSRPGAPSARVAFHPSHSRARQDAAPSACSAGIPSPAIATTSPAMLPCRLTPAAVGAGVERHARLVGRHDRVAAAGVQVGHVRGVARELVAPPASAYSGNLSSCITVGTSAMPRSRPSRRSARWTGRCRARCSRCPPRCSPGSTCSPKQCAVTLAPCSWAAAIAAAKASAGNDGARSPSSREIQSPTSLTQPSPARASRATYVGERRRARPRGRSCGCSAWCGRCAARRRISRGRSSRSWIQRGVGRRPAVADQQRPRVAVLDRLRLGRSPSSTAPWSSRPMWQCASTSPGTIQPSRDGLGAGLRLVGDAAVDDVQVAGLAVGQDRPREAQRSHGPTVAVAADGPSPRPPPQMGDDTRRAGGDSRSTIPSGVPRGPPCTATVCCSPQRSSPWPHRPSSRRPWPAPPARAPRRATRRGARSPPASTTPACCPSPARPLRRRGRSRRVGSVRRGRRGHRLLRALGRHHPGRPARRPPDGDRASRPSRARTAAAPSGPPTSSSPTSAGAHTTLRVHHRARQRPCRARHLRRGGRLLGTLVSGSLNGGRPSVLGDIAAFEQQANPDGASPTPTRPA